MKLTRTLFQITFLLVMLVVFSNPLSADTGDGTQDNKLYIQPPVAPKSGPAHLSSGTVLALLKSGFVEGMVPILAVLLAGVVAWRMMTPRRVEYEIIEEPPVEIPPLRPSPDRVTRF
jgi:hypothetical protein